MMFANLGKVWPSCKDETSVLGSFGETIDPSHLDQQARVLGAHETSGANYIRLRK